VLEAGGDPRLAQAFVTFTHAGRLTTPEGMNATKSLDSWTVSKIP
jgi:hypothetical protein